MKKLVLDLDESLLFSTLEPAGSNSVKLEADNQPFYTMLRPDIKPFLHNVRSKFEVYIWSTGLQSYLEAVWKYIDIPGITLWGRDHCTKNTMPNAKDTYEKPLRKITTDLTQIVIVDNTPAIFAKTPLNGIQIRTWRGDANDTELTHLGYYLNWLNNQTTMQRDHRLWRLETLCIRSQ